MAAAVVALSSVLPSDFEPTSPLLVLPLIRNVQLIAGVELNSLCDSYHLSTRFPRSRSAVHSLLTVLLYNGASPSRGADRFFYFSLRTEITLGGHGRRPAAGANTVLLIVEVLRVQ